MHMKYEKLKFCQIVTKLGPENQKHFSLNKSGWNEAFTMFWETHMLNCSNFPECLQILL